MTLNTPRFGYLDALRALAVVAILIYEIVGHAPGLLFPHPLAHRAAFAGLHGFELFLVISGFVLAYPALAALRGEGSASLDVRRYAAGRLVRILPAYCAVLAATIFFPYVAARYGLSAFGHTVALPDLRSIGMQAIFAEQHFGNDAFWALAVQVRTFLLFPILFAIYVRRPMAFFALLGVVVAADLFTAAHRYDAGAFAPFMLGIVAADWRVRRPAFARYALPIAIAVIAAAFFADPAIAAFPGPRLGSGIENWNPLWAIAAFALVVGCGSLRWTERALSFPGLPQLGRCAFAIALVAEPVTAYLLRKATPTLGLPAAAANAFAVAVVTGIVLWAAIDRRFADPALWRPAVAALGAAIKRLRDAVQFGQLTFEFPALPEHASATCDVIEMPAQPQTEVAMIIRRSGSPDDLASELRAAAARYSERGSFDPFFFRPRRVAFALDDAETQESDAVESPARAETHRPIHFYLGPAKDGA